MKLALGTVAFGLNYGISNKAGQTPPAEVNDILDYSYSVGIDTIDTAAAYGTSEEVLGACSKIGSFNIVTKVFPKNAEFLTPKTLVSQFEESLRRIGGNSIYALLLHRTDDLLKSPDQSEIVKTLENLKNDGLVKKIGVSAYDPSELNLVTQILKPDLVQVPGNILDQRFWEDDCISALRQLGTEIHVRSAFLQGLLLMDPDALPSTHTRARPWLRKLRLEAITQNVSPLQLCLSYMKSIDLDKIVVGINNLRQLQEIVDVYETAPIINNFKSLKCNAPEIINPAKWNR